MAAIWLYQGKILDGRNRYKACLAAGVVPEFREYLGSEPLKFVMSLNLARRHLNEAQRAVVAARLANMERTDTLIAGNKSGSGLANLPDDKVSQPEAANLLNISERTVRAVKAVEREAPELIECMAKGVMSVNEASKVAKQVTYSKKTSNLEVIEGTGQHSAPSDV